MTILLSPTDIKALVGDCDDAQMERYQKVTREAVAKFAGESDDVPCPRPLPSSCPRAGGGLADCRACWRAYLDREAQ